MEEEEHVAGDSQLRNPSVQLEGGRRPAHRGAAPAATWGRLRSSFLVLPGVVRGNVRAPGSFSGPRWAGRWRGVQVGEVANWARE